jgi:hypothetical protein
MVSSPNIGPPIRPLLLAQIALMLAMVLIGTTSLVASVYLAGFYLDPDRCFAYPASQK